MNRLKLSVALICLVSALSAGAQSTTTNLFTGVNKVIPDGQFTGVSDSQSLTFADPLFVNITDVKVVLDISGGFNGDFYAYLVHDGQFAVLLNREGRTSVNSIGYGDPGMSVTIGATGNDIHNYQTFSPTFDSGRLTGDWAQDGRGTDPQFALDSDSRTALLSSFNGTNPNGTWDLFLSDVDFGQQGTLVNWGLIITAIPEPSFLSMSLAASLTLMWFRNRRRCD